MYKDFITQIQDWMSATAASALNAELSTDRDWCTLDIDNLTQSGLRQYFDRKELGDKYAQEYRAKVLNGGPYAHIQSEADLVYALHKSMVARHKGRLMHYRDDCSQKHYRTYSAITAGLAKFIALKDQAEKAVATTT